MKFITGLTVLFACAVAMPARSQHSLEELPELFQNQLKAWPQEKIYVHTDKPYYIAGEDVWFRAYLVEGTYHMIDTTSRYVYAELINPRDSLVARVKIRPEKGVYRGHFALDAELPGGDYLLRCYTRLMEARGDECFFKKTVRIGAPFSSRYMVEPSFTFEANRGRQRAAFRFMNSGTGEQVIPDAVTISEPGPEDLINVKGDNSGVFSAAIPKGEKSVCLQYEVEGRRNAEFVTVPPPDDDFDVAFLPEGGNLICGQACRMGFKCIDSNGMGADVRMAIMNSAGDTLHVASSQYRGMGRFDITPEPETGYYAMCTVGDGAPRRFDLPQPVSEGVALRTDWEEGNLHIGMVSGQSFDEPVCLLLQTRGFLIYATWWSNPDEALAIAGTDLPSGVIQVIVADKELRPLSERLVFNNNPKERASVSFVTEKESYDRREHISGGWNITRSDDGTPLSGSFSVSVTDDRYVEPQAENNIYSELLLASELKGYIESPALYFRGDDPMQAANLDILMMTQGWSRYNVAGILKGEIQPPRGNLELGPVLTGVVKGGLLMNRGNPDYPVTMISLDDNFAAADLTITDSEGKFLFYIPEMPEGTRFLVQGKTVKGGDRVELLIDPDNPPRPRYSVPYRMWEAAPGQYDYMRRAEEKYVSENGERLIVMDEIAIQAEAVSQIRHSSYPQKSISMQALSGKELERHNSMRIALMHLGVNYVGNSYSIRGGGAPMFQIDGVEVESDVVDMLMVDDVAEIGVLKDGTAAIYGQRGGNGAVLISTKRGFDQTLQRRLVFNMKAITPLGYQPLKEFYSPRYGTPDELRSTTPDLRTTLYWNPDITVGSDGRAEIDFYAGDAVESYTVILEGVTGDGRPVYSEHKISGN